MPTRPRRTRYALAVATVAVVAGLSPASAFTPEMRVRIVDEAIRLMPKSLRLALEQHREDVLRGALEPLVHEDEPAHRPPWAGGTLEVSVASEAAGLVEAVGRPERFAEICARFGRLAHFVTDAGFPPNAGDAGADRRYGHFSLYATDKLPKFPLVFHGHDDPALARGDFAAFTLAVLEQARGEDRNLARSYAAAGEPPNPEFFDDRSIPFAVASLAYSRTVTHVVRAWLAAWERAGGDMGRTPYYKPRTSTEGGLEE